MQVRVFDESRLYFKRRVADLALILARPVRVHQVVNLQIVAVFEAPATGFALERFLGFNWEEKRAYKESPKMNWLSEKHKLSYLWMDFVQMNFVNGLHPKASRA